MFQRLRYRLRRFAPKISLQLILPFVFIIIIFASAFVFLQQTSVREPQGEMATVRVLPGDGLRRSELSGLGLSTSFPLNNNLLQEGNFDTRRYRQEIQLRHLGKNKFTPLSFDPAYDLYRSPGRLTHKTLSLYENGSVSIDRIDQNQRHQIVQGRLQSGEDDVILETFALSSKVPIRWSTLITDTDEKGALVQSLVVNEQGDIYTNIHTELPQKLMGKTPRNIAGLAYRNDNPWLWTKAGAVYKYLPEERRWLLVIGRPPSPKEESASSKKNSQNNPLEQKQSKQEKAGGETQLVFFATDQMILMKDQHFYRASLDGEPRWKEFETPEASGPWTIESFGETLYALNHSGQLFARVPRWISYEAELHYQEPTIFNAQQYHWILLLDGSSRSSLKVDPKGELLFLDPLNKQWFSLRDLKQEGPLFYLTSSGYYVTAEQYTEVEEQPGIFDELIGLGRGRLLAIVDDDVYLISASEPRTIKPLFNLIEQSLTREDNINSPKRLFEQNSPICVLDEMTMLWTSEKIYRRIQLGTVLQLDLDATIPTGQMVLATFDQELSPVDELRLGGDYPWMLQNSSFELEMSSSTTSYFQQYPSYYVVFDPAASESGEASLSQNIPVPDGALGGEIMSLVFRARSEEPEKFERLQFELSGPFRTFDFQSERISDEIRLHRLNFRMPEIQKDRAAENLNFTLKWSGDSKLYLDHIELMTRDNQQEEGISANLIRDLQEFKPSRLRFEILPDDDNSSLVYRGLDDPEFRYAINQILQVCDQENIEPWLVLPEKWTAEEHAEFFQYLAANISDPYGRQRLEDGWSQAWLRRLPLVYLEIRAEDHSFQDDHSRAASVNQRIQAMTETSSYDAVKNQVIFLDGVDYQGGRALSEADGYAMDLNLLDLEKQTDAKTLTLAKLLELYHSSSPRLPDGAEPWVSNLQDPQLDSSLTVLGAFVSTMNEEGVGLNLSHDLLYGNVRPVAAWNSNDDLSKATQNRLQFWSRLHEFSTGDRLQVVPEESPDLIADDQLSIFAARKGSEIRLSLALAEDAERRQVAFALPEGFSPKKMRLYRYNTEGRLYEDRLSKRPQQEFALTPGDILFVALDSSKK